MFLKICGIQYPPIMTIADGGKYFGVLADLLFSLSSSLNFTYSFEDNTGQHYEIKENNTFIELFMRVHRGECDIFWAPISIDYELGELVDYSAPLYPVKIIILSGAPKSDSVGSTWNVLSGNPEILSFFGISAILLAFITYIFERKVWKNYDHGTNFWNVLWGYYGTAFLEPLRLKMTSSGTRIITAVWWLTVIVMLCYVGGNMKANLAITDKGTIDTVEELLARQNVKPILISGVPYSEDIKNSKLPSLKALYAKSEQEGGVMKWSDSYTQEIYDSVIDGKSATVTPEVTVFFYTAFCKDTDKKRLLYISKNEVRSFYYHILYRKGLPQHIREGINRKFLYFATSKITFQPRRFTLMKKSHCLYRPQGHERAIGNDIILLSVIWVVGATLSGLVLLIEILVHKYFKKLNTEKTT